MPQKDEYQVYYETVQRMEPEIGAVDASAYYASAAISLKRQADAMERIASRLEVFTDLVVERADPDTFAAWAHTVAGIMDARDG